MSCRSRNRDPIDLTWALGTADAAVVSVGHSPSMARSPDPLPVVLQGSVFSAAEARRLGVSAERLRRQDVVRIMPGLHASRGAVVTEARVVGALFRNDPGITAVGLTAARLWGLPLPGRLEEWTPGCGRPIELATQSVRRRRGRAEIRWRRIGFAPGDTHHGTTLRATTRARTFLDLGAVLSHDDLVVIGDHLVRTPRPWAEEGRSVPYSILERLTEAAAEARFPGIAAVRRALTDVRMSADSPAETRLRLDCVRASLPEPEANARLIVDGADLGDPDLLWRAYGVCVEYEGRTHLRGEQMQRDIRRGERRAAAGVNEIRLLHEDLRHGSGAAIARIRRALEERGWRSGQ